MNLEALPDEELEQLIGAAQAVLSQRLHSKIEELSSLARRAGFEVSLSRIGESVERARGRGGQPGRVSGRKPVEPKYRNPEKPSETWSGRGREPRWLAEKMAAGARREQFAI